MKKIIFVLLSTLLFSTASFAEEHLIFAIDLIRHGDRTPLTEIPTAPLYKKEQLGQLTSEGMQQEKRLGEKLHKTYIDDYQLLPENFDPNLVYVRSTYLKRTKESAAALFEGLYPNQTITIHSMPRKDDYLLLIKPGDSIRPLYYKYFTQEDINRWHKATDLPINNYKDLDILADNIYVRMLKEMPLPKGISQEDAIKIINASEQNFLNEYKSHDRTDVMGNTILKTAANYFNQAIQNKTQLRYVLWSAHDSTLLGLMNTLHAPLSDAPPYASQLNFALFKDQNKYYIKIRFNDRLIKTIPCPRNYCTL